MANKMAVIVIEDWMIQEKNLSGLDLLAFALVHGCTQKGEGCWYGGYDRLAERIGGKQRGTIMAVNRLEEIGAVERFDAVIDGKPKRAIRSLWNSAQNADAQNADAKNADAQNAEQTLQKMQSSSAKNAEPSNRKDNNIGKKYSTEVEELYAMYPTKCPMRNTETARRPFCKDIIERLLKVRSFEDLKANMKRYLDENYGKNYLQNFATFLHQFPDYGEADSQLFSSPQVAPAPSSKEADMQRATLPTQEEIKDKYRKFFMPSYPPNEGESNEAYNERIKPFWDRFFANWIEDRIRAVNNKY